MINEVQGLSHSVTLTKYHTSRQSTVSNNGFRPSIVSMFFSKPFECVPVPVLSPPARLISLDSGRQMMDFSPVVRMY
jgi:hypothetical protein